MLQRTRYSALLMCSVAAIGLSAISTTAHAEDTRDFDIAPQPLASALLQFGDQSGVAVVMPGALSPSKLSGGVSGAVEPEAALKMLLAGTGLTYRREGDLFAVVQAGEGGSSPQLAGAEDPNAVEALIVTAQKKGENIQDVPIAISAFTMEQLDAQKIEGGFDLLKGVPNVAFSKSNFSGYNFQIRGIGTQAVSATTDPGVAVSFNNTTLIVNRLFEQEYVDIERVEVLRGPQGTLYGRNATGGVINVISAKPVMGEFFGEAKVEAGNFSAKRVRGHVNVPVGDTFALRGAFAMTQRDGYGYNEASETNDTRTLGDSVRADVDGRDLWTARITAGWEPTDNLRVNFLWERFKEDDNRVRTSKQLCHRDEGPDWEAGDMPLDVLLGRGLAGEDRRLDASLLPNAPLSQACKAGSLYADEAFGTPNGASLPYVGAIATSIELPRGLLLGAASNWGLGGSPYRATPTLPGELQARCVQTEDLFSLAPQTLYAIDRCQPDPYGGMMQSRDLRTIYSEIEPIYRADSDVFDLSFDLDLGEATFSSQTVYAEDEYYATQDYNRFRSVPIWENSDNACGVTFTLETVPFFGKVSTPTVNCSDDLDHGRGTWGALTDRNGDGVVDQTHSPVHGAFTVDGGGYLRDADGRRVGFYTAAGVAPDGSPRGLTSGGIYCDPQIGCSDSLRAQDLSQASSKQFNQEFRLVSNYDGAFNYSIGANYTRFETTNDYYVFINALSLLTNFWPFNGALAQQTDDPTFNDKGAENAPCITEGLFCRYVDPNPLESVNGEGHNYFRSQNPYKLTSAAIFGEAYWNVTDALKLTAGLRFTWDRKLFTPVASQLLLGDYRELPNYVPGQAPNPCNAGTSVASQVYCSLAGTAPGGRGFVAEPDILQEWREPTGRLVLDWKPVLGFTDETLVYASASRGYKGGGANPPSIADPARTYIFEKASGGTPETFDAEYVNALEVGTKNTILGGAATLNFSAFHYDYTDYQVSRIIDRRAVNDNFDAKIWGLELEATYTPTRNLRLNMAIGHLNTRIADGETSIDIMDRADGGNRHFANPDGAFPEGFDRWVVLQPSITASALCVVPEVLVHAEFVHMTTAGVSVAPKWGQFCPSGTLLGGGGGVGNAMIFDENGDVVASGRNYTIATDAPNGGAGFAKDLSGNALPNAPEWTVSIGGQYTLALPGGWDATARADFYWQADSWARVYNLEGYDQLRAWTNTNFSVWVENPDWGVKAELYVKNALDESPITGAFLNSEDSGLTTNVFTLDPRLIGLSVTKEF